MFDTGPAFDNEVAEIRAALKARPLVRWTPAFDRVIREMLGGGETVETIERATCGTVAQDYLLLSGFTAGITRRVNVIQHALFSGSDRRREGYVHRTPILAMPSDTASTRRAGSAQSADFYGRAGTGCDRLAAGLRVNYPEKEPAQ